MTPPQTPPKFAVFLIVLLDVMGLGLIIPAQPFLARHFGAEPGTVTLVGTTYALMQFVLAPVWGALSDKYGRKPILLTTLCMTSLGHLAFASATSLLGLFAARALAGAGAANISTAQAVLSDTHAPQERSRAMAIIGAAFGMGFVFGPALGGILFKIQPWAPAVFAASLAVFNILFVLLRVPETRNASAMGEQTRSKIVDFFKTDKAIRPLVFTTFLSMTAFALMEQTVGLYIQSVWVHASGNEGMREATTLTATFLVVVGLSAIAVQGYFVRKWLKTRAEITLCRFGLVTIATSLLLIPILGSIGSFPLFLVTAVVLAFGSGMFNPSMAGLVSLACPEDKQGLGLALNQSSQALGRIVGPSVAGALFAAATPAPFLAGTVLTGIALLLLRPMRATR
jgi:DHA1 family tetracycline resistance protein-like MFS transporter